MKKLIVLFLCLFTMTGCYNYIELDELAVVSSIFIDYDEKYKVKIEAYDEEDKVEIFESEGKSLTDAFNICEAKSKKKFYFRHINALIITDKVNVNDIIYYFFRNPDTNDNFAFVNTEVDPYTDDEVNVGELIKNNIIDDDLCSFFEIMKGHVNELRELAIPMFDGKKLSGLKSYKDLTPTKKFTAGEVEIFRVLKGKNDSYLRTKCGDGKEFVINVDAIKTKYKVGKKITIEVDLKTSIQEMNCDLDIRKVKDLKKLQKLANKDLEKNITEFMEILKNDETDILGINTLINNKYHNLDKKFNEYDYEVNADISIYKKGLLLK